MRVGSTPTPSKPAAASLCLLGLRQGAGDTANPGLDTVTNHGGHGAAHDDIGNGKTVAKTEYAKRFPDHAVPVARQVDHAFRNNYIDRMVRQRDMLDTISAWRDSSARVSRAVTSMPIRVMNARLAHLRGNYRGHSRRRALPA